MAIRLQAGDLDERAIGETSPGKIEIRARRCKRKSRYRNVGAAMLLCGSWRARLIRQNCATEPGVERCVRWHHKSDRRERRTGENSFAYQTHLGCPLNVARDTKDAVLTDGY
jgi:hypothetical protein